MSATSLMPASAYGRDRSLITSFTAPRPLLEALRTAAGGNGESVSAYIRQAVEERIAREAAVQ